MKISFKHRVEYAVLVVIYFIVNILPYRGALAVGAGIAWLAHYIFRFRVTETKRRMKIVLGDRYNDKEIDHLSWISWRNTIFNGVEMLRIEKMTPEWTRKVYDCEPFMTELRKHCDKGKGVIVATPHTGNWEMGGASIFMYGMPIFNIAAKQKNPLVNNFFNKIRSSPGIETMERGSANMRNVIRELQNGKILAVLPDSRMRKKDTPMPFLGGTANMGKGIAFFAKQADIPIFVCPTSRIGWGKHKITYFPPIFPDKNVDSKEDIKRMLSLIVERCDKFIQENPEQWFWFNKRWVLDPVE